jgi:multiple sugar transport system substrate-binding protein
MKNNFSRREFLKIGATGAAAAILAGCAPAATQAPAETAAPAATTAAMVTEPPKAPVTVDFLAWGDNADIPAWEKLSAMYMEQNPNVTVNVTTVADPNANYYPKLQTSIAGGTPPDVASFQGWEWQTYADKDLLASIDQLVTRDGFEDVYPPAVKSVMDSTTRNGKKYLIPLQLATMVMFYAKKPFDDAGVAYPTDDWTFDEFMEKAQQVTKLDGDNKIYGLQANGSWFRDIGWMRGTGKTEFDSIIDPKKAQFSQPEIVDIVQKMAVDVYYTMNLAPTPADLSAGANQFQNGTVGMKYEGPWWFGQMNSPDLRAENKQIEFDVVLMPKMADETRPHRGWAEGVALLKGDNVEEGWKFASFMASEEGDKVYAETTGRMPNRFSMLESFWVPTVEEKFQFKNAKAFIAALKNSQVDVVGGLPRSKMWAETVKPVGWDPMINGSASAADALAAVDKDLQAKLDEYWASV